MKKSWIVFLTLSFITFSLSDEGLTEKQKLQIFKKRLINSLKKEIKIKEELIICLEKAEDKQDLKVCFKNYAEKMKPIWERKKKYWEKYKKRMKEK
jgi:hypothetical protein